MKLSPERRAELLNEMELADQFTEKRWAERYGLSISSIRGYRRLARERREFIPNQQHDVHVVVFNSNGPRKKRVSAA